MSNKKGKKLSISREKRSNQKRTQRLRQGKTKKKQKKHITPRTAGNLQPNLDDQIEQEEESDIGEDMLEMMEKDDITFLKSAISKRSYSILKQISIKDHGKRKEVNSQENILEHNIEENYEKIVHDIEVQQTKPLLPIKTEDGVVHRTAEVLEGIEEDQPVLDKSTKKLDVDSDDEILFEEDNEESLFEKKIVSTADFLANREEELQKRKCQIGILCSGLLEQPDEKTKNFKILLNMLKEDLHPGIRFTVPKLITVSLFEVFKDLLPSYQIQHYDAPGIKLKKDTLKLQGYETSLIKAYKSYLQAMEKFSSAMVSKKGKIVLKQEKELGEAALGALCNLLVLQPYFNFSCNLAMMLVPFLNHSLPEVRQKVENCFVAIFKDDKKGEMSLNIVRLINKYIKSTHTTFHGELLTVFLGLRIKEVNLDKEKEDEIKKKKFMTHKQKLLNMSKRERKRSKKLEELEKELLETKAEENKQTKQKYLTETIKVVFAIYFRVLKSPHGTKYLSATLQGICKFVHCINLDIYHSLVSVLNDLIESSDVSCRDKVLCVQTVFTILSGHGEAFDIDPYKHYNHLYSCLLNLSAAQQSTILSDILRAAELALFRCRKRASHPRSAAFIKRLCTLALQILPNGVLGCLALVKSMLQVNRALDVLLYPDAALGDGVYDPELDDPVHSKALNSSLWEVTLLQRHYHPIVRKYTEHVLLNTIGSGEGSLQPEITKFSVMDIYKEYDSSEMAFNPAIPVPKKVTPKAKIPEKYVYKNQELETYVKQWLEPSGEIKICEEEYRAM